MAEGKVGACCFSEQAGVLLLFCETAQSVLKEQQLEIALTLLWPVLQDLEIYKAQVRAVLLK